MRKSDISRPELETAENNLDEGKEDEARQID